MFGNLAAMARFRSERGQAAVELIGSLPFIVLAALLTWQLVLVGHVAWMSAGAARSGARARLVSRDPATAARSALPPPLRRDTRVVAVAGGGVRVSVPIPVLLHRWRSPVRITAAASLGK
jgi:pilus assembly protein CpaE